MKNNIRLLIISFIFIFLILTRIYFEYISSDIFAKEYFISFITGISFLIVVLMIIYDTKVILEKTNDKVSRDTGRNTYYKHIKKYEKISLIVASLLTLLTIIYVIFLKSSLMNDIITILTLSISITNSEISLLLSHLILK